MLLYLTDVFLQSFDAKTPDDEPQFESSKPLAEWNLPVLFCYKARRNRLNSLHINTIAVTQSLILISCEINKAHPKFQMATIRLPNK